ncbi:hypothetical protein P280DRAFT_403165 [Massarina eburnea CBS 473.64]|uniref:Uncharacterized protein n=1 Tax=Massarina eburnea CBS 473.64 TaxID=1395130 RepID=A0A6A6RY61_9PLEO|nr:hypothetical protein P280DRAFT_403165 [Massarina eburnea CBS 473.64]
MGAVVSCITAVFRTIGNAIMAVISAIGAALTAVINGIVALFGIIISCLTCGRGGGRRRTARTHHTSRV